MRVFGILHASKRPRAIFAAAAWLGLLTGLSCRCAERISPTPAPPHAVVPGEMLPRDLSGGFSLAVPLERYGPSDLWKKINGGAELFISYGFRELLAGSFVRAHSRLPELEASIYEMGGDLNALGVYLAEKSEGADKAAVGWEGYQSGDGLFFYKGSYYVKIIDLSEDGSLGNVVREIAQYVDSAIRVRRRGVPEMEVFPREGMVAGSILYVHRDALGHGFLKRVFQGEYALEGKTATLFYCRQEGAAQLLAKYRDYGEEFGQVEREWQAGDLRLLSVRAFGNPELVFVRGDIFGGVVGCPDQSAALRLIRALLANIDRQIDGS
ncbi:hypothetical protein AMJ85_00790 [candidate division BRC1 bacterium SM23_51]|nr:MAG: hypothetical protein AMJ85_00790 [candidate division BRC1 bacterium SM23_51]